MSNAILGALEREVARTGKFLAGLSPDDWNAPTRCPPMSMLELATHAWRGGQRIPEMLMAGPVGAEPEEDGVTYFQYDREQVSAEVVERARTVASTKNPKTFVAEWRDGWNDAFRRLQPVIDDDPVLKGVSGLIRLSEYLRTRVVEVTVHHMDLRAALGLGEDADPGALEVTADLLRGLLGTDLRPAGMDEVRFVLTGTGRAQLQDSEREFLGPLAAKFPLLV